jgi:hypothetical protein
MAVPGRSRRRRARGVAATIAGLAVLLVAGLWWYSLRPETCYRRGQRALEKGNRPAVLREVRRLLDAPGFEPHGRLLAGRLLAREGNPAEALRELQYAMAEEATAVEAATTAAGCYYALGQFVATVEIARGALTRDPEALDARRWIASACYDLGRTASMPRRFFITAKRFAVIRARRIARTSWWNWRRRLSVLGVTTRPSRRFMNATGPRAC